METAHAYKVKGKWELTVGDKNGDIRGKLPIARFDTKPALKKFAAEMKLKPWNY